MDLGALVSPQFPAAKFADRRPELVVELAPDYIVDIEHNTMIGEVVEHPEIAGRYDVVAAFNDADFGHGEVRLLERREPAPSC